mmetsp:Transcript_13513/g.34692  ORF Transcript_13513/g.34692 Transcript_13513/m.34692 type:complete len:354 (-) Transcript_13513:143-1204(-)
MALSSAMRAAATVRRAVPPGLAAAAAVPAVGMATKPRRRRLPVNTGINFVPQQEAWVIERMGRFHSVLEPGLSLLIPVLDAIKYVHTLKEIVIEIPSQAAITQDNVTMHIDGVLYVKVDDPYKASYGVEDPEYAVSQLAQTTMRSELGKLKLDEVFKERNTLNELIVAAINKASIPWGLSCLRCEIRDIALPDRVVEDMQRQVSAERRKRAAILESEGDREAAINVAEGKKQAAILSSEGVKLKMINEAAGDAEATKARANATAVAVAEVAAALEASGSDKAVSMRIAEEYIAAFGKLAKEGNTLLLPAGVSDPAGMVAQALSIYGTVAGGGRPATGDDARPRPAPSADTPAP